MSIQMIFSLRSICWCCVVKNIIHLPCLGLMGIQNCGNWLFASNSFRDTDSWEWAHKPACLLPLRQNRFQVHFLVTTCWERSCYSSFWWFTMGYNSLQRWCRLFTGASCNAAPPSDRCSCSCAQKSFSCQILFCKDNYYMPSTCVVTSSNKGTYGDIKFILNELAASADMCSDFRIIKVYYNSRANFGSDNQGVKTVSVELTCHPS